MERLITNTTGLADAPLGTVIEEKFFAGWSPVHLERTLGGWTTLDEYGNPSGSRLAHHEVRLPAQVLRVGYGGETD